MENARKHYVIEDYAGGEYIGKSVEMRGALFRLCCVR